MSFSTKFTIIACIERGMLENYGLLLVRSIKEFGGYLADCPIVIYNPRPYFKISSKTKKALEKEGAEIFDQQLNKKYSYYDLANKVYSCAHAEQVIESEYLLFLDTDLVVLNPPFNLVPQTNSQLSIKPVHQKGWGTTGLDENTDLWKSMFKYFEIDKCNQFTTTSVDQRKIWGYWNSGVVCSAKKVHLFNEWKLTFEKLMTQNFFKKKHLFFAEQMALSIAIHRLKIKVNELPLHHNYPLNHHTQLNSEDRIKKIEDLKIMHHHGELNSTSLMNLISLPGSENRKEWLIRNLLENGIYPQNRKQKLFTSFTKMEKKMYKLYNYWTRDH